MHSPETKQIIDSLKAGRIQEFIKLAYELIGLNLPALNMYLLQGVLTNTPELISFCNSLPPNLDHEIPTPNTPLTETQIVFLKRLQAVLTNSETPEENITLDSDKYIDNIGHYIQNLPPNIDILKLFKALFSTEHENLENIPLSIVEIVTKHKDEVYEYIQDIIESHILLICEFKNIPTKRIIGKIICQKLINELHEIRNSGSFIREQTNTHILQNYKTTYQTLLTLIPLLNEEDKHHVESTIQNLLRFFETYQKHSSKSHHEAWKKSQQITQEIPDLPQIKVD